MYWSLYDSIAFCKVQALVFPAPQLCRRQGRNQTGTVSLPVRTPHPTPTVKIFLLVLVCSFVFKKFDFPSLTFLNLFGGRKKKNKFNQTQSIYPTLKKHCETQIYLHNRLPWPASFLSAWLGQFREAAAEPLVFIVLLFMFPSAGVQSSMLTFAVTFQALNWL